MRSFAICAQSLFEAYLNEFRRRWTLCRYRHNGHYADTVVMPIPGGPVLAGGGARVRDIGIIGRAAA